MDVGLSFKFALEHYGDVLSNELFKIFVETYGVDIIIKDEEFKQKRRMFNKFYEEFKKDGKDLYENEKIVEELNKHILFLYRNIKN